MTVGTLLLARAVGFTLFQTRRYQLTTYLTLPVHKYNCLKLGPFREETHEHIPDSQVGGRLELGNQPG